MDKFRTREDQVREINDSCRRYRLLTIRIRGSSRDETVTNMQDTDFQGKRINMTSLATFRYLRKMKENEQQDFKPL